jgi:hypothetical protein
VLKKQWYRFIYGLEHHNGLYWLNIYTGLAPPPLPPAPIPPGMTPAIPHSVHGVQYAATDWFSMEDKGHPMILADGSPIFSRNHTIKKTPHCPPGINVAVISTIAFSTSTFKLGVASVQANNEPVASSAAGPIFVTIECADPCSTPTGGGIAPGTVHVLPAPSDWAQAAIEYGLGCVVEFGTSYLFGVFMGTGPMKEVSKRVGRQASKWFGGQTASDAAREATEKTLRENGYDAFVANEARRQGLNPAKLDDASKKAIDAAFEKEVKEAGEQAAADAASKGSGPAAKDATESWLEKQRKATPESYSAPSNTQPSPTKSHSSKAQKTAEQLEREKNADYAKFPEAFAGDQAKKSAGDKSGDEIEKAAKDWSGAPESP